MKWSPTTPARLLCATKRAEFLGKLKRNKIFLKNPHQNRNLTDNNKMIYLARNKSATLTHYFFHLCFLKVTGGKNYLSYLYDIEVWEMMTPSHALL